MSTSLDQDVRPAIEPLHVAGEPETLGRIRTQAAQRFNTLGWPSSKLEEWKYTSLAPLARIHWRTEERRHTTEAPPSRVGELAIAELVFVNGVLQKRRLGAVGEQPGIRILPMSEAMGRDAFTRHFARYADYEDHAVTALNTARWQNGAYIEIAPDTQITGYVHLLFSGDGDTGHPVASHLRNLIVAGRGSQITVVESYAGRGVYFTSTVTEIAAGEGAVVDHYKLECESMEAFHIGTVQVHQERSSSVTARTVSIGGLLVRNETNAALMGEGASLTLDGLFVLSGRQHVDNHTVIDHARPHCDSLELYKGVLDESARGIFDGRIIVRPDAQKTNSRQVNHNLLLSETAIVDSKPTLEIHNDDVKCNHGSTIGQLDEEAMFYLRSRGIGEDEARSLLVYAFASEIVDRMKVAPVQEQIRGAMFTHLPKRLPERREDSR